MSEDIDHTNDTSDPKKTLREIDNPTIRDTSPAIQPLNLSRLKEFREFHIEYAYPATGGEADIYRIEKNDQKYILKLYRDGIYPKEEVNKKIQQISVQFPDNFVRLIDYGLDSSTNRWFEIQEFMSEGSLKDLLEREKPGSIQVRDIVQQLSQSISILHRHQILHLDLKPANILIRSRDSLHLVLTDFSVSSILPDKLSQRMTTRKGTPLYWAPEQLSGVVGKEADYWALGIIVLEILNKNHPFEGLDPQVVMWTLSTKGVEIPKNIPDDYSLLLKGLLTRDSKKRWGENEVKEWLRGKQDIPVHYDYVTEDESQKNIKPYTFQGKRYYSIESLVAAFIESPENWENAKMHLGRGYILKWLEDNSQYDHAIFFETNKDTDLNKKLFNLIYSKNKSLPFCVFGKIIDESNLYLFLGRAIRKESSDTENWIISEWENGALETYTQDYVNITGNNPEIIEIVSLLSNNDKEIVYSLMDVMLFPEKYCIPDQIQSSNKIDILKFLLPVITQNKELPLFKKEVFGQIQSEYIIPEEFLKQLKSTEFEKAYENIKQLEQYGLTKVKLKNIQSSYIVPEDILEELKSNKFVNLYTLEKAYENIKKIEFVGVTKNELDNLKIRYYIPEDLLSQLHTIHFEEAYERIRDLPKIGFSKEELKTLESKYIIPEDLLSQLYSNNFEGAYKRIKDLIKLGFSKEDLNFLESNFVMPHELLIPIHGSKDFSESYSAYEQLRDLRDRHLLISRNTLQSDQLILKTRLSQTVGATSTTKDGVPKQWCQKTQSSQTVSATAQVSSDTHKGAMDQLIKNAEYAILEDYIELAKQINWHVNIDDFPKLRKLKEQNFDSDFNSYLDELLSKKIPWEQKNIEFIDMVWKRYNSIKKFGFLLNKLSIKLIIVGIAIGYFLNDVIACFLDLNNIDLYTLLLKTNNVGNSIGYTVGTLLAWFILISILCGIIAGIVTGVLTGIIKRLEKSGLFIFGICFIVTYYLLRDFIWRASFHRTEILNFNYQWIVAICLIIILIIGYRQKLIQLNLENGLIPFIKQNAEMYS